VNADIEVARLRARVELLEEVVGALYQFAGEVGAPVRMLDTLWAVAQGNAADLEDLTSVYANDCREVQTPRRQLEEVRRIVAVGPAAAELGRLGGSRTTAAKRRAARANGRKGGRPRRAV
jgi:hypothetical protein